MSDALEQKGVDMRAVVALADGSLKSEQFCRAQARLLATAAGRREREEQQRVLRALRAGGPLLSAGLRAAISAQSVRPAHARYTWRRRATPALAVLAAVFAAAILAAGGLGTRPSVAGALELGRRPPTAAAPPPLPARPALLARSSDGVAFPNWTRARVTAMPPSRGHRWGLAATASMAAASRRSSTRIWNTAWPTPSSPATPWTLQWARGG